MNTPEQTLSWFGPQSGSDSADAAAGPSDAGAAVESDGSADGSLETPDGSIDGSADGSIDGSDASATDAGPTDASIRD